jgi:hypothetical protein
MRTIPRTLNYPTADRCSPADQRQLNAPFEAEVKADVTAIVVGSYLGIILHAVNARASCISPTHLGEISILSYAVKEIPHLVEESQERALAGVVRADASSKPFSHGDGGRLGVFEAAVVLQRYRCVFHSSLAP